MSVDFAVHHEGLPEDSGRWVLHVDAANERVLLCEEDKTFYWRDLKDCTMALVHTPSQPTMVVAVQAPTQSGLVSAVDNRAMRRHDNGF